MRRASTSRPSRSQVKSALILGLASGAPGSSPRIWLFGYVANPMLCFHLLLKNAVFLIGHVDRVNQAAPGHPLSFEGLSTSNSYPLHYGSLHQEGLIPFGAILSFLPFFSWNWD